MKHNNPIAVVVGSDGQDGRLLKETLSTRGYSVVGITRNTLDITSSSDIDGFFVDIQPKEIYFLSAYHHSAEQLLDTENELFSKSFNIHVLAVVNFLEAILKHSPKTRFFYASSCLVFEGGNGGIQTEETTYGPESPYAISKTAGMMVCQYYRREKGLFASTGILYHHDSSLRNPKFVAKKIVRSASRISRGKKEILTLGSLDHELDWGYAPDYVDAMVRILGLSTPNDYIVATGETHSVREFTELAFGYFGLDYLSYVVTDNDLLIRPSSVRIGSSERLRKDTGWKPTLSFQEMVFGLAQAEEFNGCNK